ncbi:hypothetical protein MKJ04_06735 [Pontibacter sp. E15-1]|uniref:hypothetical protein n=1 Tax=Pontibacter sp. E15-1 TaxID=2919918 RepID=UPI001F4FC4BB|nr:hypothetical protein [Pontibacter sp. E15-1]MCJ8164537.1 hypothetical protein [Pontibacter sp. E15-1]
MKTNFTQVASVLLAMLLLCSSCASNYKLLSPEGIYYNAQTEDNGLLFNYKYDVYALSNNKKYAKKEKRKMLQVVAVKITNNTDRILDTSQDIRYFIGQQQVMPLAPEMVHSQIKQSVPSYLLYLLLFPVQITTTSQTNGMEIEQNSFPIGLILAPGLTILNMSIAGSANKQMLGDLQRYNLANRKLLPGETVYGLFGLANSGYNPIVAKLAE